MAWFRPQLVMAVVLLPLFGGPQALPHARSQQPGDPFPLRRVVIPLERVPAELQRQGVLVQMPRSEFEAKVRQAAQSQESAKSQPRLVKAVYAVEFTGQALTGGSGQWTIQHGGAAPGVLPLPSLNLALSKIKLDNADAVLGELDGKNLGLGVEQPGTRVAYFDWSARGLPQAAGGVAFDLRVPVCPVSVLELKLPAGETLVAGKNAGMVTGPLDTERAERKLWRIQATGRSQIDFVIRKSGAPTAPRVVFTTLECRQEFTAATVQADFDVYIEAVQHALTELVFDYDAELQPYEVTARQADLKSWDLAPPAADAKTKQGTLIVRLRDPKQGTLQVRVRCLAPRPTDQFWTSPTLRLRQAIPRGESLQLVVPGTRPVDRWDAGQFRLQTTSAAKDGGQTLSLVDLEPEATAPRRPRLTLAAATPLLNVRQQTRWTIAPAGMILVAELDCQALRGQQFQMALQLPPPPWRVEDVAMEPKEALRSWTTVGSQLIVELQRALTPRTPGKIVLKLRAPFDGDSTSARLLPIPELVPVATAHRQATLAIHVDPSLQASLVSASAPPAVPESRVSAQEMPPWFFFNYREQPLLGAVRVLGPRTRVGLKIEQRVDLSPLQAGMEVHLEVDPLLGQPRHLDLHLSAPLTGRWTVTSETRGLSARWERRADIDAAATLLFLGTHRGPDRLLSWARLIGGERWRLSWDEPLAQRATFVLRGPVQAADDKGERRWDIPVVATSQAEHVEGEVVVESSGWEVIRSVASALTPHGAGGTRVFRWTGAAAQPALTLWARPSASKEDALSLFDHAQLATYLDVGGQPRHHFRFCAARWSKSDLPVRLPAPARQVLAVRVDGQWLDRLTHVAGPDGLDVTLPMPLDGKGHWFDIVFASEASPATWLFGREAQAPMPQLPAEPLRLRQTWRLAPDLMPLHQERLASLHQGAGAPAARLHKVWRSADAILDAVLPDFADGWLEPQRRVFLDAEAALRLKGLRAGTFGEAVRRLVLDYLKEHGAVLLDREALREAGIGPETALSPSQPGQKFWEPLGLVYVASSAAPLLTTRQRWQDWRRGQELPERLTAALADALAHGQDGTGQFCRADVWLRSEPAARHERGDGLAALPDWFAQGWTEWEPLADRDDGMTLIVIDAAAIRVGGMLAGMVVGLIFFGARRRLSPPNRLRLTILLLVTVLITMVSLPMTLATLAFWPSVVLVALLVFESPRYLAGIRSRAGRSAPSTQRRPAAIAGIVTVALASSWLFAAQPETLEVDTVYLSDAGADRALAFVRPELLKRLDDLRQWAAQPVQGAVLIDGEYQGQWQNAASEFKARFELYSFSDKAMLHVPFAGVELKEGAFLDGAPVFPTAAAGKPGYLVPIQGKGWHRLTLMFSVRHQTVGEFRELRCTIPALAATQLVWQAPPTLSGVQAPRALGEVKLALDASKKTQEMRIQHGRDGQLHIRWPAAAVAAAAGEHEVREHYFWDFDARAPALHAVLAYVPALGNRSRFEVALPEATEVRGVEVSSAGAGPALAKWQVLTAGGPRRLAIDLAAPASGPFQVQLHMALRGGVSGANLSLRLPAPLQAKSIEGGVLAYRLDDREITDKTKNLAVNGLAPAAFAAAWARAGARDPVTPTRAYTFQRAAANASLELTLAPLLPQVRLDETWELQPAGAELRLQAEWTGTRELPLVELLLPKGLNLFDVRGANVHHWSLREQLLQVWLEKPSQQVAVTLQGIQSQPLPNQRFSLPKFVVPQTHSSTTQISVRAAPGWAVVPEKLLHLTPLAKASELRYQAAQPKYEGVFAVRSVPIEPVFHALTTAEPRGGQVMLTASVLGQLPRGEFPGLQVRVRHWQAGVPRLEISAPAARQEHRQIGADHQWSLQFPPGSPPVVIVTIRGQVETGKAFELPHLEVEGGKLVEQYASWPAGLLTVRESQGLAEVPAGGSDARPALVAALMPRRLAGLWKVREPQWRCLLTAPASEEARLGQIALAQQMVQPAGGGRWLHQVDWLLLARGLRELRVALPQDAQPVGAWVEGQWVAPRKAAQGALEIPLPARTGVFHVRLQWRLAGARERSTRPLLDAPTPLDVEAVEVQGIACVPAGYLPRRPSSGFRAGEQGQLEALADASNLVCSYWTKKEADPARTAALAAWQQQFQQAARHLEYQALLQKDESALATLTKLRKDHQALRLDGAALPKASEKGEPAWLVDRPDACVPHYWSGTPGELSLTPAHGAASWWSREVVILIVLAIFVLSWLPFGLKWLVRLWPEQLAALACLAYALWGGLLPALVLGVIACFGRLLGLAAGLQNLLRAFQTRARRMRRVDPVQPNDQPNCSCSNRLVAGIPMEGCDYSVCPLSASGSE